VRSEKYIEWCRSVKARACCGRACPRLLSKYLARAKYPCRLHIMSKFGRSTSVGARFKKMEDHHNHSSRFVMDDQIKTNLEWVSSLTLDPPVGNMRKTSIICTIGTCTRGVTSCKTLRLSPFRLGPKTNSVEMIAKLRNAGMNIVRMNFSHGSYEVSDSWASSLSRRRMSRDYVCYSTTRPSSTT
jgi:hypothetical protein